MGTKSRVWIISICDYKVAKLISNDVFSALFPQSSSIFNWREMHIARSKENKLRKVLMVENKGDGILPGSYEHQQGKGREL